MVLTNAVQQLELFLILIKRRKKALCAFLVLDSLGTNNKMEATFLASTPPSSVRYWAVNLQNAMEVSRKPWDIGKNRCEKSKSIHFLIVCLIQGSGPKSHLAHPNGGLCIHNALKCLAPTPKGQLISNQNC